MPVDVNSRWTVFAGAITTMVVWGATMFGVTVPGEVGASATIVIATIAGIIAGDGRHPRNRRATDPPASNGAPHA